MLYLKKVLSLLKAHILLIIMGLLCEMVYLFCFVWSFPLLHYYQELNDLGGITNHSHWGFIVFVLAFTLLFILFGFAWWEVYHLQNQDKAALWLVLGFGVLFAGTMIFVYPVTAIDVFAYVIQSLILVQYHSNPMITPAANFPHDSMTHLAGGWAVASAPYGPLGLLIDAIPTFFVRRNLLANLLLLKGIFSALLIFEAFLTYKIISSYAPKFALVGALFIAWNPLALYEYSANGHNDVVVMLFVLLAILALVKEKLVMAFALVVVSILTKYSTLPLLPLFLVYGVTHQSTHIKRLQYMGKITAVALILIAVILGPFWAGPHTLDASFSLETYSLASFSTLIYDVSSGQITLDHAKLLGRILFGIIYLYALYLSTKSLSHLIRAAFLALFFLLAFATGRFLPWYAIWPMMLAVLAARFDETIIIGFFIYGTVLSNAVYQYLFIWLGLTVPALDISNSLVYLMCFMPAMILFYCFIMKRALTRLRSLRPA
jgi:hypothetical protein